MDGDGMRYHRLAVAATTVWALSRAVNALPGAHSADGMPVGLRAVLGGGGVYGLYAYAALWFAAAVVALFALQSSIGASRWLLPTQALSFGAALLYTISYVQSILPGGGPANSAWVTATGFIAWGMLTNAYVFLTIRRYALESPSGPHTEPEVGA